MTDIAVVICCYTAARWNLLTASIQSALAQTSPAREVVVVVDHNRELFERLEAMRLPINLVENINQRGLSGARNSGIAAARADVIAFLDDDATAAPDWLSRLAACYADPDVVAAGGLVSAEWENGRPAWFPPEFDWVVGCSYTGLPTQRSIVRNVIGCNMSFRTAALSGTGGFSVSLGRVGVIPSGCEETELCIRVTQTTGGRVVYEPLAAVRHFVPARRATFRYFRHRCFAEGISKAIVARSVGRTAALESERWYVRRTLPRGMARSLRPAPAGAGLRHGPARAASIALGLAITAAGYAVGQLATLRGARGSLEPSDAGS